MGDVIQFRLPERVVIEDEPEEVDVVQTVYRRDPETLRRTTVPKPELPLMSDILPALFNVLGVMVFTILVLWGMIEIARLMVATAVSFING